MSMFRANHRLNLAIWFLLGAIALTVTVGSGPSPQTLGDISAQVSRRLEKTRHKSVVVADFFGPKKKLTALGRLLADEFSDLLSSSAKRYRIVQRSTLQSVGDQYLLLPATKNDFLTWRVLAALAGANVLATGNSERQGDQILLAISLYDVQSGKEIMALEPEAISETPAELELLRKVIEEPGMERVLRLDEEGITRPDCLRCPYPKFPEERLRSGTWRNDTVWLEVIIDAEGRPIHIRVAKTTSLDLVPRCVTAVRN